MRLLVDGGQLGQALRREEARPQERQELDRPAGLEQLVLEQERLAQLLAGEVSPREGVAHHRLYRELEASRRHAGYYSHMPFNYIGVPDWCGEAANRKRLEEWEARFGPGGVPCPVCDLRKLKADFRALAKHISAGKEKVTVKPPAAGAKREWALSLLSAPPAVIDGKPAGDLTILNLRLTCSQCHTVLLFDANRIGIAV